jgi:hypothetical protein
LKVVESVKKTKRGLKGVAPLTTSEELNDTIPW